MVEDINVEVIVKFGGCVVIYKGNFEIVKYEVIEVVVKVVKEIKGKCMLFMGLGMY